TQPLAAMNAAASERGAVESGWWTEGGTRSRLESKAKGNDARLWASLAPHQPRSARDAPSAMDCRGLAHRTRRVQACARAAERDPARGVVEPTRGLGFPGLR